jgi:hypothetical protein
MRRFLVMFSLAAAFAGGFALTSAGPEPADTSVAGTVGSVRPLPFDIGRYWS